MVMIMATSLGYIESQVFPRVRNSVPTRAAEIFENCFSDTLQSTVTVDENDSAFMVTGDISAMWLRDSTWQLYPYLRFLNADKHLQRLVAQVSRRQQAYVLIDPYANAFNPASNAAGHQDDHTMMSPWIWERKYEVDSLCAPIYLAYALWSRTGETSHLHDFEQVLQTILTVWRIEQHHDAQSTYLFERDHPFKPSDTLGRNGKGPESGFTGMTWSAFRPSDDATAYGYNIPDNAYAVLVLRHAAAIVHEVHHNEALQQQALELADEIEQGILTHGIVSVPGIGDIYAYEVDGLGNSILMDDANLPSLLSLPFLGWDIDDDTYRRTREYILSPSNPFWYEGACAQGIGSPHTPENYVWPIALSIQGLTSNDAGEREQILKTLSQTDAGTGLMHESFDVNDSQSYTRPWFSWANAMFCEFVLNYSGFDAD